MFGIRHKRVIESIRLSAPNAAKCGLALSPILYWDATTARSETLQTLEWWKKTGVVNQIHLVIGKSYEVTPQELNLW